MVICCSSNRKLILFSPTLSLFFFLLLQVCLYWLVCVIVGFPDSSVGKESTCNAGDPSSIPGPGRSAGEGISHPLPYSWASASFSCPLYVLVCVLSHSLVSDSLQPHWIPQTETTFSSSVTAASSLDISLQILKSTHLKNQTRKETETPAFILWLKRLCLLLNFQHLEQCLVHSTTSINICWWLFSWLNKKLVFSPSHVPQPFAATDSESHHS